MPAYMASDPLVHDQATTFDLLRALSDRSRRGLPCDHSRRFRGRTLGAERGSHGVLQPPLDAADDAVDVALGEGMVGRLEDERERQALLVRADLRARVDVEDAHRAQQLAASLPYRA